MLTCIGWSCDWEVDTVTLVSELKLEAVVEAKIAAEESQSVDQPLRC